MSVGVSVHTHTHTYTQREHITATTHTVPTESVCVLSYREAQRVCERQNKKNECRTQRSTTVWILH